MVKKRRERVCVCVSGKNENGREGCKQFWRQMEEERVSVYVPHCVLL